MRCVSCSCVFSKGVLYGFARFYYWKESTINVCFDLKWTDSYLLQSEASLFVSNDLSQTHQTVSFLWKIQNRTAARRPKRQYDSRCNNKKAFFANGGIREAILMIRWREMWGNILLTSFTRTWWRQRCYWMRQLFRKLHEVAVSGKFFSKPLVSRLAHIFMCWSDAFAIGC